MNVDWQVIVVGVALGAANGEQGALRRAMVPVVLRHELLGLADRARDDLH